MTKQESQETKARLISGLGYLVHELQALQSLTDVVSFDQAPPDSQSASDQVFTISLAQTVWLDSLFDQLFADSGHELVMEEMPSIERLGHYVNQYDWTSPAKFETRLQHVLSQREALLESCERCSETDFSRKVWISAIEEQRPLSDFIEHFLHMESDILKRVIRFISDIQSEKIMLRSAGIRKMQS